MSAGLGGDGLSDADVRDILALVDGLEGTGRLRLRTDRFELTLRRTADGWTQSSRMLAEPVLADPDPLGTEDSVSEPKGAAPAGSAGSPRGPWKEVRTPLPGAFYRSPKPGAPPFVEVGDRVEAATVVAIVETMKLMNSVHAGVAGTVAEICLADAEPVERDALLMLIRPEPDEPPEPPEPSEPPEPDEREPA